MSQRTPLQSTPGFPSLVSEQISVIYEGETGRIIHVHKVSTLQGGKAPTDREVQAKALEYAAEIHKHEKRENMRAVVIDPKTLKFDKSYRINPKTLKLVALPEEESKFDLSKVPNP